jgi:hypothetical protein
MNITQTSHLSEQKLYSEVLTLLHPEGLCCPNGHHIFDVNKNIYKRDPNGMPRYKCNHHGCSKSFNIYTGTFLQGTSFSPKDVMIYVNGILEKMDFKELSDISGIPERRLKKYYDFFRKLSRRKTSIQFPIVRDWETIFDKILTAGEAKLPLKDYHFLRSLVFRIWITAGDTTHWNNYLKNIVDWDIIEEHGEKRLILTTREKKQFVLRKNPPVKNIDPETGETTSISQPTDVSLHIHNK